MITHHCDSCSEEIEGETCPNGCQAPIVSVYSEPKLEWGNGPAPEGVLAQWGARAIYALNVNERTRHPQTGRRLKRPKPHTTCTIDLLWDRMNALGDQTEVKKLCEWIDNTGLPALKTECVRQYLTSDSEDTITINLHGYVLKASPRGSFGYLYITAWKV